MGTRTALKLLLIGAMVLVVIALASMVPLDATLGNGATIALERPSFLSSVHAQDASVAVSSIGSILDSEAGISAYFKVTDGITLSQVRGLFRTIETETAAYIIGSVPVPNYSEHFDVHVYVNTDGWILAYYLREAPVSKIIDVIGRTINTTKLRTVVSIFAGAVGSPLTDVTYYDFRYPNATNILLVEEIADNDNDFTIRIPSSYAYFERSWTVNPLDFYFNGQNRPNQLYSTGSPGLAYGIITDAQFLPDTTHQVRVSSGGSYGVLVLIYRVP